MGRTDATQASVQSLPIGQSKIHLEIMHVPCREPMCWVSFLCCSNKMIPAPILSILWKWALNLSYCSSFSLHVPGALWFGV